MTGSAGPRIVRRYTLPFSGDMLVELACRSFLPHLFPPFGLRRRPTGRVSGDEGANRGLSAANVSSLFLSFLGGRPP